MCTWRLFSPKENCLKKMSKRCIVVCTHHTLRFNFSFENCPLKINCQVV